MIDLSRPLVRRGRRGYGLRVPSRHRMAGTVKSQPRRDDAPGRHRLHLAELLRYNLDAVLRNVEVLGEFDLLQAKIRFAERIEGTYPVINQNKRLVLRNAYHPILYLNNVATGKSTVPFSVELDEEKRILLVSGPNAGGKSVALKSVGLLQYMFQSGLPIPVSEGSSMLMSSRC